MKSVEASIGSYSCCRLLKAVAVEEDSMGPRRAP